MDRAKNIFDRIGSLIPGYRGYAEREGRRNCDKILRDSIVEKLIYCEKNLYELMTESLNQKDKFKLNELEVVRKQINTFISKIKYAPHGVTSFFADNQIKEDELLRIYQFDLSLAESVIKIEDNIQNIDLLKVFIKESFQILTERNNYISEFK
jgi:hypothetical protein